MTERTLTVRMPGKVYFACFDPLATSVPAELGLPEPILTKIGKGYRAVYHVTEGQLQDMLYEAQVWGSGLAFGTDPDTQREARAVLRWVEKYNVEVLP